VLLEWQVPKVRVAMAAAEQMRMLVFTEFGTGLLLGARRNRTTGAGAFGANERVYLTGGIGALS
jgi:hypothetical protein